MKKPLPIGISDFKEIIENGYVYIDKSLLIEELLEKGSKVSLIPRPRRFGKTLNLSMLRYFFEKSEKDASHLFTSLNIWKNQRCKSLQGQFPVIFITLKDIKYNSWSETIPPLKRLIAAEYERHDYLLRENALSSREQNLYKRILCEDDDMTLFSDSLKYLSKWLSRHHKKNVIILIDEYDAPAHSAYVNGYYDTLIAFLRNWLSGGLKDNSSLEKGVLTGILRITKESIFSDLNNISTFTILGEEFQDKFGLIEQEVAELLKTYDLSRHLSEIRQWYDGYRFGSKEGIYNPWSVLNCISKKGALAPYWVNTSENTLVKKLITEGSDTLKEDLEQLMRGEVIEKFIDENVVFANLTKDSAAVWSLLLLSGYLTIAGTPSYGVPCQLRIPNAEVGEVYKSMVREWFAHSIQSDKYYLLLKSLTSGNVVVFSKIFEEFVISAWSAFDISSNEPEKIYHIFVLGMLVGLGSTYEVKSNRESGLGRYDIMLIPKNPQDLGIIMEFKKIQPSDKTDLETAAHLALKQIENKKYPQELYSRGINNLLLLGIVFEGKQVLIRSKTSGKT